MIDVLRSHSWTPGARRWGVGQLNMCREMVIVGPPPLLPPPLVPSDPRRWSVFYISGLTTFCFVLLLCVCVCASQMMTLHPPHPRQLSNYLSTTIEPVFCAVGWASSGVPDPWRVSVRQENRG